MNRLSPLDLSRGSGRSNGPLVLVVDVLPQILTSNTHRYPREVNECVVDEERLYILLSIAEPVHERKDLAKTAAVQRERLG